MELKSSDRPIYINRGGNGMNRTITLGQVLTFGGMAALLVINVILVIHLVNAAGTMSECSERYASVSTTLSEVRTELAGERRAHEDTMHTAYYFAGFVNDEIADEIGSENSRDFKEYMMNIAHLRADLQCAGAIHERKRRGMSSDRRSIKECRDLELNDDREPMDEEHHDDTPIDIQWIFHGPLNVPLRSDIVNGWYHEQNNEDDPQ